MSTAKKTLTEYPKPGKVLYIEANKFKFQAHIWETTNYTVWNTGL